MTYDVQVMFHAETKKFSYSGDVVDQEGHSLTPIGAGLDTIKFTLSTSNNPSGSESGARRVLKHFKG
ncbi:MAG TPA: hypothetical protein VE078_11630 [Thermoanaerobaculia bacterium]|nr:hypothetical protein [Thermoanaerobaculia bacterium]